METKTAKIISVQENQRQFEYQGTKYFEHWIKYEGSDKVWVYASKTEKCEKFKAGETATFDCDQGKTAKGYDYHKIKPKSEFKKGEVKDQGVITFLSCFSSSCQYFAERSDGSKQAVFEMTEEAFNKAMQKSTLNK